MAKRRASGDYTSGCEQRASNREACAFSDPETIPLTGHGDSTGTIMYCVSKLVNS